MHERNAQSDVIKTTLKMCSETKNSDFAKFWKLEFRFELQILKTRFLRRAPGLTCNNLLSLFFPRFWSDWFAPLIVWIYDVTQQRRNPVHAGERWLVETHRHEIHSGLIFPGVWASAVKRLWSVFKKTQKCWTCSESTLSVSPELEA